MCICKEIMIHEYLKRFGGIKAAKETSTGENHFLLDFMNEAYWGSARKTARQQGTHERVD